MNWAQKAITGVLLSVASMTPTITAAVCLSLYETAGSAPDKQSKIPDEAYSTAVAQTVKRLRSSTFADGKVKAPRRLENDRKLADAVDYVAEHQTDAQAKALSDMIGAHAAAQSSTELEGVISNFLLTEARKQLNPTTARPQPSPKSTAHAGTSNKSASDLMITRNSDGTFTIQKEPPNGAAKDSKAGGGLVVPPQVVVPLIPATGKKPP